MATAAVCFAVIQPTAAERTRRDSHAVASAAWTPHRLTDAQRRALFYGAADRRDYFGRLRDRMKATGFPESDPLYVAACAAWDACHAVVRLTRPGDEGAKAGPPPPPEWMRHVGPPEL